MNAARVAWVDYAKGLGIFLVVLGHTLRGLHSSRIIEDSPSFHAIDHWIYSFHMPLFFLLSGLFAERKVERSSGSFLQDKLATIMYPYLVWSTLQTLMTFGFSRYTNSHVSPSDFYYTLIYPIMQFWFLYALFLITLLYYLLRRSGLGPSGVLAVFALLWSSQSWIPGIPWWPLGAIRIQGMYYGLGSVLNQVGGIERIERIPRSALVLVVLIGYGIVTACAWSGLTPGLLPGALLTLCGIVASLALAVLISGASELEPVQVLGRYSLEIYVAHTIASAGIRILLQKVLKIDDITIHLALGTMGGLALPLCLAWLCRRYQAEFLVRLPKGLIRSQS